MLDIDMPEMDGLQTLSAIKKLMPALPVIMCSGLLEKGNSYSIKSLLGGASDYVSKPLVVKESANLEIFRKEIIKKIKSLCGNLGSLGIVPKIIISERGTTSTRVFKEGVEILAIGVSTGGPKALAEVIPLFPADFPVPIVIVQHMPPIFTKTLAESLAKKSNIDVQEAFVGAKLQPGVAWVAPGGYHMALVRKQNQIELVMNENPPENSCRPSVDVLFRSVAEVFGPRALAIVLTGMGQDGFEGAKAVRQAGGQVFVQDEASSVVWGMPGVIAKAGIANRILPLTEMAGIIQSEILRSRTRKARPRGRNGGDENASC